MRRLRGTMESEPVANPTLPWDRLMEASDSIGRLALRLAAYKDTAGGYSVAAAHVAALRQTGIPYSLRPRRDASYPYGVFVLRKQERKARAAIGLVGLGADSID